MYIYIYIYDGPRSSRAPWFSTRCVNTLDLFIHSFIMYIYIYLCKHICIYVYIYIYIVYIYIYTYIYGCVCHGVNLDCPLLSLLTLHVPYFFFPGGVSERLLHLLHLHTYYIYIGLKVLCAPK